MAHTDLEAVTGLGIRLLSILVVLRLVEEAELFQSLQHQMDATFVRFSYHSTHVWGHNKLILRSPSLSAVELLDFYPHTIPRSQPPAGRSHYRMPPWLRYTQKPCCVSLTASTRSRQTLHSPCRHPPCRQSHALSVFRPSPRRIDTQEGTRQS